MTRKRVPVMNKSDRREIGGIHNKDNNGETRKSARTESDIKTRFRTRTKFGMEFGSIQFV